MEENLMSMFDSDNLELNMTPIPEMDEEENTEDDAAANGEESLEAEESEENIDPAEDDSSERVGEGEGEEEGEESSEDGISPTLYSSFASVLNEQGLLPSLDLQGNKIETIDDLAAAFKGEISNQVKQYLLDKVGEQGYEALEKGISLAEYQTHQDNVQTLDTITEEVLENDLDLAKKIIYQDYISQGLSQDRAARILKKSVELGNEQILEDARTSLESLKEVESIRLSKLQEERAAQAEEQAKAQERIDNDLKNSIYNSKEFIPGMKLNKAIQDQVYQSITKVVGKSPTGVPENQLMRERRENPIEFDSKLYYLYELTKGFKDFSKILNKSESSAVSKLESDLRKTKFQSDGTPSYLSDPESYGGIGTELVI